MLQLTLVKIRDVYILRCVASHCTHTQNTTYEFASYFAAMCTVIELMRSFQSIGVHVHADLCPE